MIRVRAGGGGRGRTGKVYLKEVRRWSKNDDASWDEDEGGEGWYWCAKAGEVSDIVNHDAPSTFRTKRARIW